MLIGDLLKFRSDNLVPIENAHGHTLRKGGNVKNAFALLVLGLLLSMPSFGADNVVGHSAEVAGKDSYKAARVSARESEHAGKDSLKAVKVSAKETAHAGKAVAKFLF